MKKHNTSLPDESQENSEKNDSSKVLKQTKDYRIVKMPLYKGLQLSKSRIEWAIHNTQSMTQAARLLNIAYNTFKKYAEQYGLFQPSENKGPHSAPLHFDWNKRANDILDGKHPNYPVQKLQWLLLREGKLQEQCCECGHSKSRVKDNKIPLLIDFIDKDHHNHEIENLRMLCYNCYFILDRPMLKMTPQTTMQNSIEHYTEKFEEILEEKTEEINIAQDSQETKTVVSDFNWGDIQIPDKV